MSGGKIYLLKLLSDDSIPINNVLLNETLLKKHGFPKNNIPSELIMGSLNVKVIINPYPKKEALTVSSNIMEQLNLPELISLNVNITENNKIKVGPILGIFAKENKITRLHRRYLQQPTSLLNINSELEGILLIYFSYKEIDFKNMRINGIIFNFSKQTWQKRLLPFPDVIYNRGIKSFPANQRMRIERILQHFERMGIKKINSQHDFDKWETYRKLIDLPGIAHFLPETVLYNNIIDLKAMLTKHDAIFAKGCLGNNGKEVIKITKDKNNYFFSYYLFNHLIRGKLSSLLELEKRLLDLLGKKKIILQQGIHVINVNGNAADIRALLQKNKNNNWNITNIALRVAANFIPVTSTSAGSQVYRFAEGLQMCGLNDTEIKKVENNCRKFLTLFLRALESKFGLLGEIGVDLAIDHNHNIWFIECNANPAKTAAMISGSEEEKRLSYLYPLQFSKFLAGF